MTREGFIRKWLGNKDYPYTPENRDKMREDLDQMKREVIGIVAHIDGSSMAREIVSSLASNNIKAELITFQQVKDNKQFEPETIKIVNPYPFLTSPQVPLNRRERRKLKRKKK